MTEGELWDVYELSHTTWKKRMAQCHPDIGGDQQQASYLNAIWTRAKVLFARLGIGKQI